MSSLADLIIDCASIAYFSLRRCCEPCSTNVSLIPIRLSKDTFTEGRINETIFAYPELIKELYADFASYHEKTPEGDVLDHDREHNKELQLKIIKSASSLVNGMGGRILRVLRWMPSRLSRTPRPHIALTTRSV